MLWIKRNLFFVITVAVGLLLTGYCGYLLFTSLSANAAVREEYNGTVGNLQQMQQKSPFPSKENVQAATADQQRVQSFLADFRKSFALFPTPPNEDQRGFKTYLEDTFVRFRAGATNAGVQLPEGFEFGFPGLTGKLTYPPADIPPWMQQLGEVSTIVGILYGAKVNYISDLERVPVSTDDTGATLQATPVTNQWGIVTPYKMTFRGFSTEIAAVLEGFARASNCFIIKAIDVAPDKSVQPMTMQTTTPQAQPMYVPFTPQPQYPNPNAGGMRGRDRGMPMQPRAAPVYVMPAPAVPGATAASASAPVTVLAEGPLLVTVSVDVVKLNKTSEH